MCPNPRSGKRHTNSWLIGATSIFNIFPVRGYAISDVDNSSSEDTQAIFSDWKTAGNDIRFAMRKVKVERVQAVRKNNKKIIDLSPKF